MRVLEVIGLKPFLRARVELQPDLEDQRDAELTALERNVQELFREVVARSPQLSDDLADRSDEYRFAGSSGGLRFLHACRR